MTAQLCPVGEGEGGGGRKGEGGGREGKGGRGRGRGGRDKCKVEAGEQ
jgi:hypothetical protein